MSQETKTIDINPQFLFLVTSQRCWI